MRFILSIFLIPFLMLSGCAPTGYLARRQAETKGEIVIAEGEVLVDEGDLVGTKKRALVEAEKRAVEMVVGVYISGRILVEKAIAVKDKIIAKTEGYIDSYKILSEGREGEFYKIKIKALVRVTQINEDLGELGLLSTSPIAGNPRIGIWFGESIEREKRPSTISSEVITQHLLDRGYQVIESKGVVTTSTEEQDILKDLSKVLDADILIFGSAESYYFTQEKLGGFISFRAVLKLKAIKVSNSEVLLTLNKKASGIDVTRDMAGLAALTNVAELAGEELASRLAEEWNKRYNIRLRISGLNSLNQLNDFKKFVEKFPPVEEVNTRQFQPETVLDIYLVEGGAENFLQYLRNKEGIEIKKVRVGIIEISF